MPPEIEISRFVFITVALYRQPFIASTGNSTKWTIKTNHNLETAAFPWPQSPSRVPVPCVVLPLVIVWHASSLPVLAIFQFAARINASFGWILVRTDRRRCIPLPGRQISLVDCQKRNFSHFSKIYATDCPVLAENACRTTCLATSPRWAHRSEQIRFRATQGQKNFTVFLTAITSLQRWPKALVF